ncbi:diaminopimelate epimerase [Paenibacillus lentus]|uniref:Diaminopimelate epimerase n=1 Tax=Paenibacillus lentus TaxID=1338368 RepID=A0A3Q8S538_9BACL|nr:diaminopimelate epimerase [Paenibacillus lentus]AZK46984.1 diaminopimelate epimerase [Paenibacillus lentus]
MEFTKMHGLGNDFLVFYGEKALPKEASYLAQKWCNRNFGIGADGLVFILPSEQADFNMRIINSDGTEAEQCGNAIRCVCKYVYEKGYVRSERVTIETLGAGVQQAVLQTDSGVVTSVRIDMGEPILAGRAIPTKLDASPVLDWPIEAAGQKFNVTAVSMGNPHCIIYVEDAASFDLNTWGPRLETHLFFPQKTNVEFATIISRNRVEMRVWERGAGATLACGTGACATLVSSVLHGYTNRAAWIGLPGGDLFVEWDEVDNHVYMNGPAETVYEGSVNR